MKRTTRTIAVTRMIGIVVAAASLGAGLTACADDNVVSDASPQSETTSAALQVPAIDVNDNVDARRYYTVESIVRIVTGRGGDKTMALGALAAAEAESGWYAGNSGGGPGMTRTVDVFGWQSSYPGGAESGQATEAAVQHFMDVAATVPPETRNDPVAFAVAVQFADPRGYDPGKRVFSRASTNRDGIATEYSASLPKAAAALQQVQ
ncbi:hypothetical protein [Rhodococcus globerulus]|uniref:hypothetical protein n=1 Tax=Rhodococcus globerulus TaxID=33008 RepID=UPI001F28E3D3|nr:hypothetical protein [Rhodococcus globerulus]MCE4265355.1 hypothetical protein [Rhodococcus globerulus]